MKLVGITGFFILPMGSRTPVPPWCGPCGQPAPCTPVALFFLPFCRETSMSTPRERRSTKKTDRPKITIAGGGLNTKLETDTAAHDSDGAQRCGKPKSTAASPWRLASPCASLLVVYKVLYSLYYLARSLSNPACLTVLRRQACPPARRSQHYAHRRSANLKWGNRQPFQRALTTVLGF